MDLLYLAYLGGSDRGKQSIVDGQEYCFGYWQRGVHRGKGICFIIAVPGYMFQFLDQKTAQVLFYPGDIFYHSGVSGFEFLVDLLDNNWESL